MWASPQEVGPGESRKTAYQELPDGDSRRRTLRELSLPDRSAKGVKRETVSSDERGNGFLGFYFARYTILATGDSHTATSLTRTASPTVRSSASYTTRARFSAVGFNVSNGSISFKNP